MALEFLGSIGNFFGPIGQALGAANTIYSTIKGFSAGKKAQKSAINQKPGPSETRAAELYEAILNPDNPIIRKLQEQYRQNTTIEFLNAIRNMQIADRRNLARGRASTFFNPERADEAVDYLISRAAPKITQEGLPQAQTAALAAASGLGGFIEPEMLRQRAAQAAREKQAAGLLTGTGTPFAQAQKLIEAIQGINVPQDRTYYNNMGWVNWNPQGVNPYGTLGIRG